MSFPLERQGEFCPPEGVEDKLFGQEVARLAVLGQSTLRLLGGGLLRNPRFDTEVEQCCEEIFIGYAVGVDMTRERKSNLAAAFILRQLPLRLTSSAPKNTLWDSSSSIWSGAVTDALIATRCLNKEEAPMPALRQAMPFLQYFYPPRRQVDVLAAMRVLPESAYRPFVEMWPTAAKLAEQLPLVTAQQTEWKQPQSIKYYRHLTLNCASAYLANLLNYMFELSARLSESDDDVSRGHFIY